ncbi:MAG: 4Fe-4S dicluster domain-containing protein [Promethearchaeota archaeon]
MSLNVDFEFKKLIYDVMLHEKIDYCYQCNRCTENCPVAKETDNQYNPRQLILGAITGLKNMLISADNPLALYGCTLCDTCDEVCPNDIPLTEIFGVLKNLAARQGITNEGFKGQGKAMYEFATSVPIGPAIARRRVQMGLPEKYELPVDEVKALLAETGFADLIKKLNPEE